MRVVQTPDKRGYEEQKNPLKEQKNKQSIVENRKKLLSALNTADTSIHLRSIKGEKTNTKTKKKITQILERNSKTRYQETLSGNIITLHKILKERKKYKFGFY